MKIRKIEIQVLLSEDSQLSEVAHFIGAIGDVLTNFSHWIIHDEVRVEVIEERE